MSDADVSTETEKKLQQLKEGEVLCNGKTFNLQLSTAGLNLKDSLPDGKFKGLSLIWRDVISVQPGLKAKDKDDGKVFHIQYMELQSNKKLRIKTKEFLSVVDSSDVWINIVQEQINSVEGRPKKLFVLVNPIGGSGSSQQVLEKKVRPIMKNAQIQIDVRMTEYANHALEIVESQDFSSYDGIMIMGGDGSYHEVLHSLTLRTQKKAGVNYDDTNSTLQSLYIPIGIIPTGTGNGIANYLSGVMGDMETSILRVVRGEHHRASVYTVHSGGKFLAMSGLLVGYGFFSDMIKRTSELRWMKRARYLYSIGASVFGKKREWQCELEYKLAPNPIQEEGAGSSNTEANDGSWIRYDPKDRNYSGISCFIANAEKIGDQRGVPDLFVDHTVVMVDTGCSNIKMMKYLFDVTYGKGYDNNPINLDVIKRVTNFRIKLIRDESETDENVTTARARARDLEHYVNIDGEPKRLDKPEIEISIIPSFVPVYGIRLTDVQVTNSSQN